MFRYSKRQILAILFGRGGWDGSQPVLANGKLTRGAPHWVRKIDAGLRGLLGQAWRGFAEGWKKQVLCISKEDIAKVRTKLGVFPDNRKEEARTTTTPAATETLG